MVQAPPLPGDDIKDPIKIGIWYPSKGTAAETDLGLQSQFVVPNGRVAGRSLPLVVISHGTGGSLQDHYDTALALAHAGFVVAALQHPHDNRLDQRWATYLYARPPAVRATIDYMLRDWRANGQINPQRIGLFGFSSGGLTALLTAGGVPDLGLIPRYCASHAAVFVCQLLKKHPSDPVVPPPESDVVDKRVRSIVVAAPAIGFTFTRAGLSRVRIPVQLWQAGKDQILPAPDYVEPVRDRLPRRPEYHLVVGADHLDFLAPCSDALAQAVPAVCQETGHFDRTRFHRRFNAAVVAFFRRTLR